ncbi:MAG: Spy/CpxP family protein refolding chaperone [Cyanobacteria bacterium P01_D01_bin.2]
MYRLLARASVVGLAYLMLGFAPVPYGVLAAVERNPVPATAVPQWLRELDLTSDQTQQVIAIDALLHQQMIAILTVDQYVKLQTYLDAEDADRARIQDADLELSLYQRAALDVAFQDAMTNLLNILSREQQQLFFYNLENPTPVEPTLGI